MKTFFNKYILEYIPKIFWDIIHNFYGRKRNKVADNNELNVFFFGAAKKKSFNSLSSN